MRLPRLNLDMASPPRRTTPLGRALLLAGGLAIVAAAVLAERGSARITAATRELDQRLDQVQSARRRTGKPVAATPQQLKLRGATQAMAIDLSTPWEQLLSALEAGQNRDVALLVIEPVAAQRTVRLQLESRTTDAMLDYLQSLQSDSRLADVVLQMHQPGPEGPARGIRFQVKASWGGQP